MKVELEVEVEVVELVKLYMCILVASFDYYVCKLDNNHRFFKLFHFFPKIRSASLSAQFNQPIFQIRPRPIIIYPRRGHKLELTWTLSTKTFDHYNVIEHLRRQQ